MSVANMFTEFINNLAIENAETISSRYGELTAALNKAFRNLESKTANTIQVGSFGRKTGINGISDLDMLYIMPKSKWDTYKDGKQLKLLQDTKSAILNRYPKTDIRVDRLIVTVTYTDFHVEVQPVFEQDDGSFKYPDTKNEGTWKITKSRLEMNAIAELDREKNSNLRRLCKMSRAWKNKHGVGMGGLLVDTLAYNFLKSTNEYDTKSFHYYDQLNRDFFKYLSELPKQDRYDALGSKQHVKVKKPFQRKAKKAYSLCVKAIEAEGTNGVNDKWKKVFGRPFPANVELTNQNAIVKSTATWDDTEEFIEDRYPIDIRYTLKIDCDVKQNGFREYRLSEILHRRIPLLSKRTLEFEIVQINVSGDYSIEWKVLNRGDEARKRNKIRGQIVPDAGYKRKTEPTMFKGDHVVECYAIKNGAVVAKDRIHVPISTNG
ncbi:MAG: nucleotide-binding domain-containing protein [Candidatus Anammoxibacter sp.]